MALLAACLIWVGAPKVLRRLDFFRIRRVEIAGLQYLPADKVIAALELGSEASVFDDLAAAGSRLRAMPGVGRPRCNAGFPAASRLRWSRRFP